MLVYLQLLSAILLISIDNVYLHIIKKMFTNQIELVQKSPMQINYFGAILSYVFLITALNYFIIKPKRNVNDAFLLGLVIYGVYETTNYALFTKWHIYTVIIDTLWGGILFASTTYLINMLR